MSSRSDPVGGSVYILIGPILDGKFLSDVVSIFHTCMMRLIRIDAWADCNTGTGSVLECLIKLCQYCLSATCEALVFIGASGHRQRFQVSMRERGSSSAPCASALDALVLVQRTTTVVQ